MSNGCLVRAEYLRTILYKQAFHPRYDLSRIAKNIFYSITYWSIFIFIETKFSKINFIAGKESRKVYPLFKKWDDLYLF